jgi:hypothetical protein
VAYPNLAPENSARWLPVVCERILYYLCMQTDKTRCISFRPVRRPMSILYTTQRTTRHRQVRAAALTPVCSLIYPTGRNQCNYAENKGVNSQAAARASDFQSACANS